ncbi:thiamine diphosphokinase [Streptobacillus felis]|uniref:Thiamine diphosphokinase n=1 Tax=Streptobacillus felis TaxID=1384509 RepID=A0A7Z0PFE9_9FUSO|nr:thiamine diphosphokinase [Streptobacillus felis]NYV28049.1 thiamine diphosphokinase [Streptobacillus felis]
MKYCVFLNGEYPEFTKYHLELLKDRIIYCADGGTNFAYKQGIVPHTIVGDLDSISPEVLSYYKNKGVKIHDYSSDKDYTDFGIALLHICGFDKVGMNDRFQREEIDFYQEKDVLVFGATGGRMDMSIGNAKLLAKNKNMKYISHKNELMYYVDKEDIIKNMSGKKFSLIPLSDLKELTLEGFVYNLKDKDISRDMSLVSNIIKEDVATVNAKSGDMLIIIKI